MILCSLSFFVSLHWRLNSVLIRILDIFVIKELFKVTRVASHGQLWQPASRNTAWRVGFNTPADYNDMETACVLRPFFDVVTPRWCNICGGRPGTKTSRPDNSGRTIQVIPGTGTITGEYKSGGTIKLKYKMTANHKGYFLVKLCVTDSPQTATQSCFDE